MIKGTLVFSIALLLISGCAQIQSLNPSKTIRNSACFESQNLKILQVIEDGFLAYICPVEIESHYKDVFEACWKGDLVFMSVPQKENNFVDDQKITLPSDACFAGSGTYRYMNKENNQKTIRAVQVIESQVPNPNYKE